MPKDFSRTARLGEQIRRDLSELIRDEVRDPRVGMVSLTEVRVARDLSNAKIFFTMLGEADGRADSAAALNRAAGFLRRELGSRLNVRKVPELHFVYDDSIERGAYMEALIGNLPDVKSSDETRED